MTGIHLMWLLVGLALGGMHATILWGVAKRPSGLLALTGIGRLLLIAVVLVLSAIFDGILPSFVGWILGFFASIPLILRWSAK